MLSKSQISFVKSLHQKKYRKELGLFLVEGIKSIKEFLQSNYQIHSLFYTPEQQHLLPQISSNIKLFEVNEAELVKISALQTPQGFLALVYTPKDKEITEKDLTNQFTLVLDGVQDPGNLGTIIRTADWFGIKNIICSLDTVEAYNPKTVQSTMGSLSRINIFYLDLNIILAKTSVKIYGALLDGQSIYDTDWAKEGIIVLGNEGKGISDQIISKINEPITIPRIGAAESLNVAVSAAIFCSEVSKQKK